jgi:hypothetical protein
MKISMKQRAITVLATSALAVGASLAAAPAPASAYSWDPHVLLQGKIGCNYSTSNVVKWAWVSGSNGESGWASLGGGGMTRPYSFQFNRVPTSTMNVTVNWGCSTSGSQTTSFGLNRPSSSGTATRNICYWSPCYL